MRWMRQVRLYQIHLRVYLCFIAGFARTMTPWDLVPIRRTSTHNRPSSLLHYIVKSAFRPSARNLFILNEKLMTNSNEQTTEFDFSGQEMPIQFERKRGVLVPYTANPAGRRIAGMLSALLIRVKNAASARTQVRIGKRGKICKIYPPHTTAVDHRSAWRPHRGASGYFLPSLYLSNLRLGVVCLRHHFTYTPCN
ncbi:hypothetical protein F5Y16DRAFT_268049 [Xylariaceae sp. FL0255]|nr:hypothetical protein F5Y16DRAFT_268049 [Xylariaceae sp. FL0255]